MTTPVLLSVTASSSTTITLHFDRAIKAGTGNIVISDGNSQSYMGAGGLSSRIIGATDTRTLVHNDTQISYSGQDVTIQLSAALKAGLHYSVTMQSAALLDNSTNDASSSISSTRLFGFTASGSSAPATPAAVIGASIHFTDTGTSSADYITSAQEQTLTGTYTGTLGVNEFIQVSLDNGASWHQATANADTHAWNYIGVIDTGNLTGSTFSGFNGTLLARVSNSAGGNSGTASHSYTYSHHPIEANVSSTMTFSSDTGGSSTDLITQTAAQTVSGTYSGKIENDQTLQISLDGGASWVNVAADNHSWQANVTLTAGSHTILARVSDIAGNTSSTTSVDYKLLTSTVALAGHALALATGSDTGISSSDGITNNPQKVTLNVDGLHGFHAGDTIEIIDTSHSSAVVGSYVIQAADLYYGDDYFTINQYIPTARNTVDITLSGLSDGSHGLAARIVDVAGNTGSTSSSAAITVDTQGFPNDTLSGNHFIETQTSVTGTLTTASAITDQVVQVTMNHGVSWQAATLTQTDATHAGWSLATDLSTAQEYGVRISDTAGNVTSTAYYLSARETTYNHQEYTGITLYAGGGIDNITVGANAWVNGGGGYGDTINTGDNSTVIVGNDSYVTTGNGANTVSTGFGAHVTTGTGNDVIYCSTIDGVVIRGGLGSDKLTANTQFMGTMGGANLDVQGIEELHFGFQGANSLTILTGSAVRTFSDSGTLTISADATGSTIHLNGSLWSSGGTQNGYQQYHTVGNEILLIGANITIDTSLTSA
ncbi:hypothetical protein GTP58_22395 [Duganella sp. CY15W]|uniref:Ig-like domain-containing protein n=1 Tax=Duganella sp. CY15W TaxID=2692172 RepID=UPI001369EE8C|nr:Ig-like domain-containing protein [Duganella sp. CY15W]MYM31093.1 hypothetical protein [Duganella sp. CY15W]